MSENTEPTRKRIGFKSYDEEPVAPAAAVAPVSNTEGSEPRFVQMTNAHNALNNRIEETMSLIVSKKFSELTIAQKNIM